MLSIFPDFVIKHSLKLSSRFLFYFCTLTCLEEIKQESIWKWKIQHQSQIEEHDFSPINPLNPWQFYSCRYIFLISILVLKQKLILSEQVKLQANIFHLLSWAVRPCLGAPGSVELWPPLLPPGGRLGEEFFFTSFHRYFGICLLTKGCQQCSLHAWSLWWVCAVSASTGSLCCFPSSSR